MPISGIQAFLEILADFNVRYIFGNPGTSELPLNDVVAACRIAEPRRPDRIVLLDLPPDVGLVRAGRRSVADRIEREALAFHERLRAGFLELAGQDPERFLVVDATRPPEEVFAQVWADLAPRLGVVDG